METRGADFYFRSRFESNWIQIVELNGSLHWHREKIFGFPKTRSPHFVYTRFALRLWEWTGFRSVSKKFSAQAWEFFERNTCFCWERKSRRKRNPNQNNILRPFLFFLYPPNFGSLGQKCGRKERKNVEVQQLEQQLVSNA